MTDRIPDEIMREAKRLASMFNISTADIEAVAEFHIVPAIMARDQRAAEIAREHIYSVSQWGWADVELEAGNRRAAEIEASILSYDEAQQ